MDDDGADAMSTQEAVQVAVRAVREAGAVALARFGDVLAPEVKTFAGDVVTDADRAAEAAATAILTDAAPQLGIVGEEGTSRPGSPCWVLDALDGTLNFVRGDPYWCTALALVDDAGPLVSAVHQPATGLLLTASRGGGVRDGDGRGVRVGAPRSLSEAVVCAYVEQDDLDQAVHRLLVPRVAGLRVRGSGSLDMAGVALGVSDVWLGRSMQSWDRDPGSLLVTEAGGAVTFLPGDAGAEEWFAAASSPQLLDEVRSTLHTP
ncbi:inositol monophosphatase family protein [uncultured Pseudokineococcus sp.]|uniref:inositol monophosphatase family protein n=1 Tax=uncultured Pseudokineococcus sp. TaxID=1642928 RepID=UPI00262DE75E|nr:inositol monophosphatase family protein [uncultured Pseudokineococcus sp.]